jgi:hypothetical protein
VIIKAILFDRSRFKCDDSEALPRGAASRRANSASDRSGRKSTNSVAAPPVATASRSDADSA